MISTGLERRAKGRRPASAVALAAGVGATALALTLMAAPASAEPAGRADEGSVYQPAGVIPIPTPGSPLFADVEFGDQASGRVYLSDLANSTLDVIDGGTSTLLAQVRGFTDGPAGVIADDLGQVWAGDGAGAIKVVSASSLTVTDSVGVGAPTADEIGYDPVDEIIAVTSPDATSASGTATPWVTFIDARPQADGTHRVLGHVVIPGAGPDSIEQPQWDATMRTFVEAVRSTDSQPDGVVVRLDPTRLRVQAILPVGVTCSPGGLAAGPHGRVLLGCNNGAPVLMDVVSGHVLAQYSGHDAGGADEVSYNAADGRFYAAEAGAAGPPPLPQLYPPTVMVVDGQTGRFVTDIALDAAAPGFHQVTALGDPARVYVPEQDGVHVYAASAKH
ncbi:YncE family protein [Microbacterium sp. 22242]|uniref:YncE family protein n=1 Tax=Microbacterium sp. 22242 TaxID=3453896 RepID=UPI003F86B838